MVCSRRALWPEVEIAQPAYYAHHIYFSLYSFIKSLYSVVRSAVSSSFSLDIILRIQPNQICHDRRERLRLLEKLSSL